MSTSPTESASTAVMQRDASALKASMAAAGVYWPSNLEASYAAAYSNNSAALAAAVTAPMTVPSLPDTSSIMTMSSHGYHPYANPSNGFLSSFQGVTRSLATSTTPSTPKKKPNPVPAHMKDDTYWDRRKKNNDSARRSRESRRMKEEQIAIRVVYLEQENLQLKTECQMLKLQIDKLTMMMYGSAGAQR